MICIFMLEEVGTVWYIDNVLYNYRTNTGSIISFIDIADKAFWGI